MTSAIIPALDTIINVSSLILLIFIYLLLNVNNFQLEPQTQFFLKILSSWQIYKTFNKNKNHLFRT